MFTFGHSGSFDKTEKFLRNMQRLDILQIMNSCGREGVQALSRATPVETGLASESWGYTAEKANGVYTIAWTNSNVENGLSVVILLQYGHGTGTGGYVAGRDFINPAIRPIFDKIEERVWKAVTSA